MIQTCDEVDQGLGLESMERLVRVLGFKVHFLESLIWNDCWVMTNMILTNRPNYVSILSSSDYKRWSNLVIIDVHGVSQV